MPNEIGRDGFGGLRCDVPGCKKVIHAFTGLQELNKLQAHMRRAHRTPMNMNEALDRRVEIEEGSVARKLDAAIEDHDATTLRNQGRGL